MSFELESLYARLLQEPVDFDTAENTDEVLHAALAPIDVQVADFEDTVDFALAHFRNRIGAALPVHATFGDVVHFLETEKHAVSHEVFDALRTGIDHLGYEAVMRLYARLAPAERTALLQNKETRHIDNYLHGYVLSRLRTTLDA